MTSSYDEARTLYDEQRWEDALNVCRALLTETPAHAQALALSSMCLLELGDEVAADEKAQSAVTSDPSEALGYVALARVCERLDRFRTAENAINRALQLCPDKAAYHGVAAYIQQRRQRWKEALEAAERGLAFDPWDPQSMQVKLRTLIKLGRHDEARDLMHNERLQIPTSAVYQAHLGWTELESNQVDNATAAFREALRIDPELEWAREGLAEVIRLQLPPYGLILRWFLRLQRYRGDQHSLTLVADLLLTRFIERLGRISERLKAAGMIVLIGRALFAYASWIARPISNFMLLMHPVGRPSLTHDARQEGRLAGLAVAIGALSFGGIFIVSRVSQKIPFIVAFIEAVAMVRVLGATYDCRAGWPRQVMSVVSCALLTIGLYAVYKLAVWAPDWDGLAAFTLFINGTLVIELASQVLRSVRVTRRPSRGSRTA